MSTINQVKLTQSGSTLVVPKNISRISLTVWAFNGSPNYFGTNSAVIPSTGFPFPPNPITLEKYTDDLWVYTNTPNQLVSYVEIFK